MCPNLQPKRREETLIVVFPVCGYEIEAVEAEEVSAHLLGDLAACQYETPQDGPRG